MSATNSKVRRSTRLAPWCEGTGPTSPACSPGSSGRSSASGLDCGWRRSSSSRAASWPTTVWLYEPRRVSRRPQHLRGWRPGTRRRHQKVSFLKFVSALSSWWLSIVEITHLNGRRWSRSPERLAAAQRRCAAGSAKRSAIRAYGTGSRRWSGRSGSCVRRTRSCGRPPHILRWRSSTAGPSHESVHRRSS